MYNYVKGCGIVIFGFGIICGVTDLIQGDAHPLVIMIDGLLIGIGGFLSAWEED